MSESNVAHHFDSAQQQHEAANLGMWTFLVTEIMFFGGMFAAYAAYRYLYFDAFAEASHHLDLALGGINTAVLLTSSLTMEMAVHAAQTDNNKGVMRYMLATALLGLVFFIIKFIEYGHKFEDRLVPGLEFAFTGPDAGMIEMFYVFYFIMTGIHAVHLVIGIGLMGWIFYRARRREFSTQYYTPVEMVGLYWHFVDIVWIFLFPLLYLVER